MPDNPQFRERPIRFVREGEDLSADWWGGTHRVIVPATPNEPIDADIVPTTADSFATVEASPSNYYECGSCLRTETGEPVMSGSRDGYYGRVTRDICPSCAPGFGECTHCQWPEYRTYMRGCDGDLLCSKCFSDHYFTCHYCSHSYKMEERAEPPHLNAHSFVCKSCYEDFEPCAGCEEPSYSPYMHNLDGWRYCKLCIVNKGLMRDGIVLYDISKDLKHDKQTFSVEAEVEFEGGSPWYLGEYHSHYLADEDHFFPGWRAEEDGSLDDGGEFIGPILAGAGGLAEILLTLETLKANGAYVEHSCGQHTTVAATQQDLDTSIKVQQLTAVMEEALYATTGGYQRMLDTTYCSRIKNCSETVHELMSGYNVGSRDTVARIRDYDDVFEFRYPPGTLSPEQATLNIGMCKLITQLAVEMSSHDVRDYLEMAIDLAKGSSRYSLSADLVHQQILMGLQMIVELGGWHEEGMLKGLPYPAADPPTIGVSVHGNSYGVVTLPSKKALLRRLRGQVTKFYSRMVPSKPFDEGPKERRDNMLKDVFQILDFESPIK